MNSNIKILAKQGVPHKTLAVQKDKAISYAQELGLLKVIPYFRELIFVKTFKEEDSSDKQLLPKLSSIEMRILSVISQYN